MTLFPLPSHIVAIGNDGCSEPPPIWFIVLLALGTIIGAGFPLWLIWPEIMDSVKERFHR